MGSGACVWCMATVGVCACAPAQEGAAFTLIHHRTSSELQVVASPFTRCPTISPSRLTYTYLHFRVYPMPSSAEANPDEQTFESSEELPWSSQVIDPLPAPSLSLLNLCVRVWLPSDVPHAPLLARDCDNVALAFALSYLSSPMKTNRHLA
jgi:hypothetical protein